jgi:hypothetical protein
VGFIYVVSVLAGAAVGRRAVRRPSRPDGAVARLIAAVSAGLGAAAAVPMAWLPARAAKPPVNVNPELVVVMTAGAGIVVGVVVALAALSLPAFAGGVRAVVAWTWLAGLGSAAVGYATRQPFRSPRLGVVDAPSYVPAGWWSGPYLMVGVAALLGLAVAAVARWGGAHRFGVALSGLGGPAVVAAAYLIAGPGSEPYYPALIAVGAGLIASTVVALPGRPAEHSSMPAYAFVDDHEPLHYDELDEDPIPARATMGQPPNPVQEDYSHWLRDISVPR